MTRQTRWTLVAVACTLIVVGGTPGLRERLVAAAAGAPAAARRLALGPLGLDWSIWLAALALTGAVLYALRWWLQRPRAVASPARRVARLHRQGFPVPVIARQTGLSQDAVRDLVDRLPPAAATAPAGKVFRPARGPAMAEALSFTDVLHETSYGATR